MQAVLRKRDSIFDWIIKTENGKDSSYGKVNGINVRVEHGIGSDSRPVYTMYAPEVGIEGLILYPTTVEGARLLARDKVYAVLQKNSI